MRRRRNEYEQATELSTVSSAGNSGFNVVRRSVETINSDALNMGNAVISGNSPSKLNLLISLVAKTLNLPIIVVSDSFRSQLASLLQNMANANFSFVRHNKESAYYNFLRNKNVQDMMLFLHKLLQNMDCLSNVV